eukprot:6411671-Amphidinium_carterae.2
MSHEVVGCPIKRAENVRTIKEAKFDVGLSDRQVQLACDAMEDWDDEKLQKGFEWLSALKDIVTDEEERFQSAVRIAKEFTNSKVQSIAQKSIL